MKELITAQKALQEGATALQPLIQAQFLELDFKGKLNTYRELGSDFMGSENYFTGRLHGVEDVSLYDELYWERHTTNSLEDIEEMTSDHAPEGVDFDEYLETSEDPRPRVFRAMLNNCIGEATYDW